MMSRNVYAVHVTRETEPHQRATNILQLGNGLMLQSLLDPGIRFFLPGYAPDLYISEVSFNFYGTRLRGGV
jgi:hypothetical protein